MFTEKVHSWEITKEKNFLLTFFVEFVKHKKPKSYLVVN